MGPVSLRPTIGRVVVVIPAHNEERRIGACLASVAQSVATLRRERPRVSVELVVVLDRCTDRTSSAARGAHLLVVDVGRVGAARRAGVELARTLTADIDPGRVLVVNTDADGTVPASWLPDLVTLVSDHDVVLGEVEPDPAEMDAASLEAWWLAHPRGRGSLHGANLAVRLDAYLRAGGFPDLSEQEDLLLVRALRATGASVVGGTRITTSARRTGRVRRGFAGYLRDLDRELANRSSLVDGSVR